MAAGQAAVLAGFKVKYTIAADLVETLYRGLADNTVGKVIDQLLRHDAILVDELGFAPLDDIGTQLLFRFVAAAYERRSLGVASHWPFDQWGRFLPAEHRRLAAGPPAPSRRHRRHRGRVVPHEGGPQPCRWPRRPHDHADDNYDQEGARWTDQHLRRVTMA